MLTFKNHFRHIFCQLTSNICLNNKICPIETSFMPQTWQHNGLPSLMPSCFCQNAQGWQGAISQILEGQGLGYKNQSRKKVCTLFPGPKKYPINLQDKSETKMRKKKQFPYNTYSNYILCLLFKNIPVIDNLMNILGTS